MEEKLSPVLSECSFLIPEDAVALAWTEHAPFAFWLTEKLKPRTFVELGTHLGYSYFAVCQVVKKLGLATACYAVDTWKGDEHAGFYDESVFADVVARNQKYSAFSTLVRSTFDQAVTSFADRSIDLLHIDGRHFYDDVKADFDLWLPKVADGGIVLFHDTNVRERGFGVWRLFEELKTTWPTFEFLHGHGLGVLAVGEIAEPLRALFSRDEATIHLARAAYSALGAHLQHRYVTEDHVRRTQLEAHKVVSEHAAARARIELHHVDARKLVEHEHAEALKLIASEHAATIGRMESDQTEALQLVERDHIDALKLVERDNVEALTRSERLHVEALTLSERDHAKALARSERVHAKVLARSERDHASELARCEAKAKNAFSLADQLRSDFSVRFREATDAGARHREDLIRYLSQQKRPTPVSRLPSFLKRQNPLAARDTAYLRMVRDYETIASSPLFDPVWYLEKYPDVAEKGEDPVHHYLKFGGIYPMSPSPHFDVHWYLQQNPDVQEEHFNPLLHLIRHGAPEGRPLGLSAVHAYGDLGSVLIEGGGIEEPTYDRWVRECDTLSGADRMAIRAHIETFARHPLISVVMPVYNTSEAFLREAIDSVLVQLYPHWELCIADDASPSPHVVAVLEDYAFEPRVKWMRRDQNGHISAATNSALTLAKGEFVALMDHDDILPEHALYEVAHEIDLHPDADIIYSDEDHIDGFGRRNSPYFKTDWNRELMLGHNMISHLGVYRRSLIEKVGGLREGFEGSQDYDLALRAADASSAERIRHIPAVLYHWRQSSGEQSFSESQLDRCAAAARRAVAESLERHGEIGAVEPDARIGAWQRVRRVLPAEPPLVSLVIPTKDMAQMLATCVDGLLNRTDYSNIEIIIVDHESQDESTHALFTKLKEDSRVQIMPFSGPFNYSAINNAAVKICKGSLVGLINNDIDVIGPNWLTEMVSIAVLPDVGAVGARLLYADGRVQHAGVVLGVGGIASHFCKLIGRPELGYFGRALMTSGVSAVTGACLLVKKLVFEEVGGLDERNLPVAFNDVDFCLKLWEKGYRNIYTPHAELFHFESVSRGSDMRPERVEAFKAEVQYMFDRWHTQLERDPYFNLNFSLSSENFELKFPARRRKPWSQGSSSVDHPISG